MNGSRKLTLAACCGAHAIQDGLLATLYVLLPVLAQAFGLSYSQVVELHPATQLTTGLVELSPGLYSSALMSTLPMHESKHAR